MDLINLYILPFCMFISGLVILLTVNIYKYKGRGQNKGVIFYMGLWLIPIIWIIVLYVVLK